LASVISGSTTRRSSFAFGSVVLIRSWRSSEFDMLRSIASRWLVVRFSFRNPCP
jgi:tetrahydromethanopterin S-methyltransferase subunit E